MADNNNGFSLTNCCFCFSLRAGSIIIACLSLIFSVVGAGFSIYLGVIGGAEGWVDLAIDLIHLVLACILIHGIRTEQERLLRVWVVGTGILVGLSIILGIVIIIFTSSFTAAVLLLVVSAIQIYFLLVVRSYARSLTLRLPVAA
ncbi:uncharacterized protein LOC123505742 [Portunus trituberculatus]|uniref:uncharacterized protein LOC123505742 n=1 Tax=Portunus trituberculatus TaxID=210409 RepID=UPI001E1CEB7F|nr:uncharacterized protein LOC123505742 [Portunus trituberculatus]